MLIPVVLQSDNSADPADVLRLYFGDPYPGSDYTGASFDARDALGARADHSNRFTADDFVAITLLSVDAGPFAVRRGPRRPPKGVPAFIQPPAGFDIGILPD